VLIPAGIALVILALAWNPWNRKTIRAAWAGPVAVAAAFVAVFPWIVGAWPGWVPNGAVGWLLHIAIGMGILGVIDALLAQRVGWGWRLAGMALASIGAAALVLRLPLLNPDEHFLAAQWVVATGALAMIWWLAFRESSSSPASTRALAPAALTLLGIAFSLTQISSGSVLFTRLSLAVAGAAGSMLIVALLRKDHLASPGGAVATVLLLVLLLAGHFFAEVTTAAFFILAASPLLVLALRCTSLPQRRPLLYQLLALLALMVPLAITVVPLLLHMLHTSDNVSDLYGV
jgi:hypothetical protein